MNDAPGAEAAIRTRVFLSYSRRDGAFMQRLAERLESHGYAAIFDESERPHHDDPDLVLSAQDDWWLQLKRMIAASDVMIFIVSPDSATSRICDDEIAHARLLGRRIIPVLRRPIDFDTAPERLRALNVRLDFVSDDEGEQGAAFASLLAYIQHDIEWHRQGARLVRLAQQWASNARPQGELLRAGAINDADGWLARRPANAPEVGELVLEYLAASRELEQADRDTLLRGVANGFAIRADKAASELRTELAAKCVGAAALMAEDVDFTLQRAGHAWRLGARAVLEISHVAFRGHTDALLDAQWATDGTLVASASRDGSCRIWSATDGREIHVLGGDALSAVRATRFLPDGKSVVTAGDDGFIRIWEIASGVCRRAWRAHSGRVMAVACAPDGAWIASGGRDEVIVVTDTKSGAERFRLEGHSGEIVALSISPNGTVLGSAAQDGKASTWDLVEGRSLATSTFASEITAGGFVATSAEFSPDGDWIVSGGPTGEVAIWNARTGALRGLRRCHEDAAFHPAFSPDGRYFVTAGAFDRTARVWDANSMERVAEMVGHGDGLWRGVFSPDGSRVATIDSAGEARLWDAKTGGLLRLFAGHERYLNSVAFSPDGRRLLTAGGDGRATAWDASVSAMRIRTRAENAALVDAFVGEQTATLATIGKDKRVRLWTADGALSAVFGDGSEHPQVCALSPDGEQLIVATPGRRPTLLSAATGEVIREFRRTADWTGTRAAFSTGNGWIAIAHREGVVAFDAASAEPAFEFDGEPAGRVWVAFSLDGKTFIAGDDEGGVGLARFDRMWRTLETTGHAAGVTAVDLSPNGGLAASCGWDGRVRIWSTSTGDELATLELAAHRHAVDSVLFLDEHRVLACARDGRIRIVEWSTGREFGYLSAMPGPQSVALSPDRMRVATAGLKGVLQLWDLATRTEIARADASCSTVFECRFTAAGDQLLILADADSLTVWDYRRELRAIAAAGGHPGVLAAAALSCGVGVLGADEGEDFLFAAAPRNLACELEQRLDRAHAAQVAVASASLRSPRPAECYLASSARDRRLIHPATFP